MISIIIVSHSKNLADEVIKLCDEMKKFPFPLINGSGIDGEHFGSNPLTIKECIENNYSDDGIIIIADIGSSILNSELAIEMLEEQYNKNKIKIADTPLVEGAIVAVGINDGNTTLEELLEELKDVKNFQK